MKTTLLFSIGTFICLGLSAQQSATPPNMNGLNTIRPYTKKIMTGAEAPASNATSAYRKVQTSANGTQIGQTTYDLQTNASIQNRILAHSDGTISAVWTYSTTYDIAASDRGTGYAYFDGTSWSAMPTNRIESQRGGWPSILSINGNEFNTLHNTQSSVVTLNQRGTKGSGTWSESNISDAAEHIIWNRTANGGPNDQTIHMVGVTAPTGNGGTLYQGLDGALVYYRSLDGGTTWDQQAVVLPGMDSSLFNGFGGDSYQIKAKGNTVVLGVFNTWDDSFIMKSTDNGTTWTKSVFVDLPFVKYVADQPGGSDVDGDMVPDTVSTTDNSGAIAIDSSGMAHVFYGNMRVLDADLTDNQTTYFPYTNGLVYWNETMQANDGEIIAWAQDYDGDGVAANANETDIAAYFTSLASFPDAAIDDATGTVYVTYSGYMENKSNGSQSYRHVFLVRSPNLGCSWGQMDDLTPNDDYAECVFASIANITDSVRFIYQEDFEPGLAVRGDEDSYDMNQIVYVSRGLDELSSLYLTYNSLNACETVDSVIISAPDANSYLWSNGATTQTIELTTSSESGDYWCTIVSSCGNTNTDTVNVDIQAVPPVPTIAYLGNNMYESSATSGNQWYVNGGLIPGATGQTFDAANYPETYITVVVSNSAGCSEESAASFVSVEELAILNAVNIFPNPATNVVTIKVGNIDNPQIELRTVTGQLIQTVSVKNNSQTNVDVSSLSTGMYLVKITANKVTATQKLIIE